MKTVLVVDDAALMRQMISDILSEAGYNVVGKAADGAEAVRLALEHHPDLVTMDVMMPVKNGIEATRDILRQMPETNILIISSVGQESLVQEALDVGASGYLLKPFRKYDVLNATKKALAANA